MIKKNQPSVPDTLSFPRENHGVSESFKVPMPRTCSLACSITSLNCLRQKNVEAEDNGKENSRWDCVALSLGEAYFAGNSLKNDSYLERSHTTSHSFFQNW